MNVRTIPPPPGLPWSCFSLHLSLASVTVSSPGNGTSAASPVHYAASASTSTCSSGVASLGIYVNDRLRYVQQGTNLSTDLALAPGSYQTVVQAWDNCGGARKRLSP